MSLAYFASLFPQLQARARQAIPATLRLGSTSLHRCLDEKFSRPFGDEASLVGDPAFEAMFGWTLSHSDMASLKDSLLDPRLVDCLQAPPAELKDDYAFPLSRYPYTHQLAAWQILCAEKACSVVISSGTGSGKTECFMLPILHRLARQSQKEGRLEGVRALFLYPLNALISSQRDRLDAWTRGFGGDVRFCLYNGNTKENVPATDKKHPNEVLDRSDLRQSPPPILFTNATMLEYMLVRAEDAPILEKSQGKLEWIVLDEAHSYIGSQAAELALLLRRVQIAFGVDPQNVRFVATSATIGDPDGQAGQNLKNFLADVAGVATDQVTLITGQRSIPELPNLPPYERSLEKLEALSPEENHCQARYDALCASTIALTLRDLFCRSKFVATLSDVCKALKSSGSNFDQQTALRWLDLLSWTSDANGTAFLPLRAHIFGRGLPGLWACADPSCSCKQKSLYNEDWPFGAVWLSPRTRCDCGSPVYELVTCNGCRRPYLRAQKIGSLTADGLPIEKLLPTALVVSPDDADIESADDEEEGSSSPYRDECAALLTAPKNTSPQRFLNKENYVLEDVFDTNCIPVTLNEPTSESGSLRCLYCQESARSDRPFYRYNRIGTPYLQNTFIPILLEFAPDGKDPANHPCRGRKMLTFNDSRQDTARSAMRIQQFAELTRIRSLIYHICLRDSSTNSNDIEEIKNQLIQLKNLPENIQKSLRPTIKNIEHKFRNLQRRQPISFESLVSNLQNQRGDFDALASRYHDRSPRELAEMFVFREFGRRPTHSINLETMGLVALCYPELDKLEAKDLPSEFADANLTLQDWKSFLKLCLDFQFRGNGAVNFNRQWKKWLGMTYTQGFLLGPDAKEKKKFQKFWPKAQRNSTNKLVRLLAYVLKLDISHWEHADIIDNILKKAWNTLVSGSRSLCQRNADGYLLDVKAISFIPLEKAWLCPFSLRFLDTVFHGVSPYLPRKIDQQRCHEYSIPLYPHPFGASSDPERSRIEARQWIDQNADVAKLRSIGQWSASHDAVIEMPLYFVTQEHSAQLSSDELNDYTSRFKEGRINILSCSTTMEMGIDIGGVSLVGMSNVPPHPANYLQRAGRSGRRGETRALVLTMCKENPHEMGAFGNSRWAFDTPLPTPQVSLSSKIIIQRHINAFLLTDFLKRNHQIDNFDIPKMNSEAFFIGDQSPAKRFSLELKSFKKTSSLVDGLHIICRNSPFYNENPAYLALQTAKAMDKAIESWIKDYNALLDAEKELISNHGKKTSPAYKALEMRKKRMTGEYLLKELVTQEFLPAHGFPLHIATFDTMHLEKFLRDKKQQEEGNLFLRRNLPSRDLPTALTEYAPGNSIAINGLVYESKGITLNWHIPASEQQIPEIQNIRSRWRCSACHSFGTSSSRSLSECPHCGNALSSKNWHEYLEPAGFAVDFYSEPTNNSTLGLTPQSHANASINGGGEWRYLGLPAVVRFRCTSSGSVFYSSLGAAGLGYAVCLACGRVEPITTKGELPSAILHHKKLRGGKDEDDPAHNFCPASQESMRWKIKSPLWLGCEVKTDVLEIQLLKEDGTWLNDQDQALPIAIALRDALAAKLGIQTDELNCATANSIAENSTTCTSLFVYDKNAAGYASSAGRYMTELLQDAYCRLLCKNNGCATTCPYCILSFDMRYQSREVDRHKGLEILTPNWLDMLKLPTDAQIFGPTTSLEPLLLEEAVLDFVLRHSQPNVNITLYLGDNRFWLPDSPDMLHLLDLLRSRDVSVELAVDKKFFDACSAAERALLIPHMYHNTSCSILQSDISLPGARLAVSAREGMSILHWAVYERDGVALLLKGSFSKNFGKHIPLTLENLLPQKDGNTTIVQIDDNFKTSIQDFGTDLWSYILPKIKNDIIDQFSVHRNITCIHYSDRYCNSPLTIILLFQLIKSLKKYYKNGWNYPSIFLYLQDKLDSENLYYIWDNWSVALKRNNIIENIMGTLGKIVVVPLKKNKISHARRMEIDFDDGTKLQLWFDQGMGFMQAQARGDDTFYPFTASVEEQANILEGMNIPLKIVPFGTVISVQFSQQK